MNACRAAPAAAAQLSDSDVLEDLLKAAIIRSKEVLLEGLCASFPAAVELLSPTRVAALLSLAVTRRYEGLGCLRQLCSSFAVSLSRLSPDTVQNLLMTAADCDFYGTSMHVLIDEIPGARQLEVGDYCNLLRYMLAERKSSPAMKAIFQLCFLQAVQRIIDVDTLAELLGMAVEADLPCKMVAIIEVSAVERIDEGVLAQLKRRAKEKWRVTSSGRIHRLQDVGAAAATTSSAICGGSGRNKTTDTTCGSSKSSCRSSSISSRCGEDNAQVVPDLEHVTAADLRSYAERALHLKNHGPEPTSEEEDVEDICYDGYPGYIYDGGVGYDDDPGCSYGGGAYSESYDYGYGGTNEGWWECVPEELADESRNG
jgi:hypothetical protein